MGVGYPERKGLKEKRSSLTIPVALYLPQFVLKEAEVFLEDGDWARIKGHYAAPLAASLEGYGVDETGRQEFTRQLLESLDKVDKGVYAEMRVPLDKTRRAVEQNPADQLIRTGIRITPAGNKALLEWVYDALSDTVTGPRWWVEESRPAMRYKDVWAVAKFVQQEQPEGDLTPEGYTLIVRNRFGDREEYAAHLRNSRLLSDIRRRYAEAAAGQLGELLAGRGFSTDRVTYELSGVFRDGTEVRDLIECESERAYSN